MTYIRSNFNILKSGKFGIGFNEKGYPVFFLTMWSHF